MDKAVRVIRDGLKSVAHDRGGIIPVVSTGQCNISSLLIEKGDEDGPKEASRVLGLGEGGDLARLEARENAEGHWPGTGQAK